MVGVPGGRHPRRPGPTPGQLPDPSGKCEFKSSLAEGGNFVVPVWRSMYTAVQPGEPIDPLPDYVAPFEPPDLNGAVQAARWATPGVYSDNFIEVVTRPDQRIDSTTSTRNSRVRDKLNRSSDDGELH